MLRCSPPALSAYALILERFGATEFDMLLAQGAALLPDVVLALALSRLRA